MGKKKKMKVQGVHYDAFNGLLDAAYSKERPKRDHKRAMARVLRHMKAKTRRH